MSRKPVFTRIAWLVLALGVVAGMGMFLIDLPRSKAPGSKTPTPEGGPSTPAPAAAPSYSRGHKGAKSRFGDSAPAWGHEHALSPALPSPPQPSSVTRSDHAGALERPVPVERYPNIEAPDKVSAGQEIAVQVSLTLEQLSPETKILSGAQKRGKLQLQMAEGERTWTLTVILTAPGMEITRGTNYADITLARDSDSTIAVFYLRAQPINGEGNRDTRILATLWHKGAFLARISRPLTIVATPSTVSAGLTEATAPAQSTPPGSKPASRAMLGSAPTRSSPSSSPPVQLDPAIAAPDLTIMENRVANILRVDFYGPHITPVKADIPNPGDLRKWINAHFAQMASRGRGFVAEPADPAYVKAAQLKAWDSLRAFGAELYDRYAPPAFKDLFLKLLNEGHGKFHTIQVFSDDPSLPWELMRPAIPDSAERMDFLGASFSIARWPLTGRTMRPPQSLAVEQSVVIAPSYQGAQTLQAANRELAALKVRGFIEVPGNYAAVRDLATHPPQGIVHFAGHGTVMDKDGVPQFAILLQDSEMDPEIWRALGTSTTTTHPLFFFNACDVGESSQFMNDVDGWAPALLDSGASGYIGALWPVSDEVAELFAATFYKGVAEALESNKYLSVAHLLTMTRGDVFHKTQDATALAYVFYGDPKFVLVKSRGRK